MSKLKAIGIGLGAAVLIVGGIKGYAWADETIKGAKHTSKLPTTSDVTLTKQQGDSYCSRIINQISGWTGGIFSYDDKVFTELLNMTDANLIFVSNCFDMDFRDQNDSKTLAQYIKDNDNVSITWDNSDMLVIRLGQITNS